MIEVLSIASECYPLVKTGGLADVVGALPKAMAPLGVAMRTLVPGYPSVMGQMTDVRVAAELPDFFDGWAKLLWRLKVSGVKSGRLPLMGVRRDIGSPYAAALAPFLVIEAIRSRTAALGYKTAELSWILENNLPMRRMIEAVGGKPYKTYRVYQKSLVQAPA